MLKFVQFQNVLPVMDAIFFFGDVVLRAGKAMLLSCVLSIILYPLWIKFLRRRHMEQSFRDRAEVRELADIHEKKKHTPTMGGVIMVACTVLSVLPFIHWNKLTFLVLFNFLSMALLGCVDDSMKIRKKNSKGISGRMKLLSQAAIVAVTFFCLHCWQVYPLNHIIFPFTEHVFNLWPFLVPIFFFFVFAGTCNGTNLTDGLDGLLTGCILPVLVLFSVVCILSGCVHCSEWLNIYYISGIEECAVMGCGLLGTCMVFLWYNGYPASIFMGDTGSLSLGGFLSSVAICTGSAMFIPVAGAIFLIESLSVIAQVASFQCTHRRIFRMAPIHHHFELCGCPETKITVSFWMVSCMCCVLALFGLFMRG